MGGSYVYTIIIPNSFPFSRLFFEKYESTFKLSINAAEGLRDRAAGNVCKGLRPLKVNCPKGKRSWPGPYAFHKGGGEKTFLTRCLEFMNSTKIVDMNVFIPADQLLMCPVKN